MVDEPRECECGEPPYVDGAMCPLCFRVWLKERMNRPGGPTIGDFVTALSMTPRCDDEEAGDDDERE